MTFSGVLPRRRCDRPKFDRGSSSDQDKGRQDHNLRNGKWRFGLSGRQRIESRPAEASECRLSPILADNGLRVFGYTKRAELDRPDRFTGMKAEYRRKGPAPTNLRYRYTTSTG